MMLSIIIPVYNAEKYLERCLNSILKQNYSDYEIILVNDGSKDNSLDICSRYAGEFDCITVIDKENGGASSARNAGIDNAIGDFIAFVDSDDYICEDFFETVSDKCMENGLSVFTYNTKKGNNICKRNIPQSALTETASDFDKIYALSLSKIINSPCSKIFCRSTIEKYHLRFDEKMSVGEDFNFCLEYALKCKGIYVENKAIYIYDIGENSASLTRGKKEDLFEVSQLIFDTAYKTTTNSSLTKQEKGAMLTLLDKLRTDGFGGCVIEETRNTEKSRSEIVCEIRKMCQVFNEKYPNSCGYIDLMHFAIRMCIRFKMSNTLFCFGKLYQRPRKG